MHNYAAKLKKFSLWMRSLVCRFRGHPAESQFGGATTCKRCHKFLSVLGRPISDERVLEALPPDPDHHFVLKPHLEWNPLLKYPPNHNCWCGEQKKAKKCCLRALSSTMPAVDREQAKILRRYIKEVRGES